MGIGDYLFAIFASILVFGLLILTTRILSYKSKKILKGNYMQIVETVSLGVTNRIHLVKIGDEFFLISATNKNIEFLTKVNLNDYKDEGVKNPISEVIDFKAVLKKYVSSFGSQAKNGTEKDLNDISKQGYKSNDEIQNSDVTFKDNLEKLKKITNTINGQRSENEQKKEY
ncbi:flagellar protein FliO/FliZ [Ruminiclostridium sufflavum DSM 19573]|uniref:Flagellar protein FliO/FliZ n=1 Tax=Ruminiclostridium sufflavum DSM 19573 TaxID=1121337 RepID=A0A318XT12_9FIRM|nr:flagellar biosynthetic protein FliO [Ruminiclostridium sufflavum]PYG89832.1 flagellar protein FliO/FliZ [Ruminiclostridium sufflavum DSM 19573]